MNLGFKRIAAIAIAAISFSPVSNAIASSPNGTKGSSSTYVRPQKEISAAAPILDSYILGPGDRLQVEVLDLSEFSGYFSIGPDGLIYFPRLRALYVQGLTVEELRHFLTNQLKQFVRKPEIYIRPVSYRPVRVYVGGEVKRPGYYTVGGSVEVPIDDTANSFELNPKVGTSVNSPMQPVNNQARGAKVQDVRKDAVGIYGNMFPTVFDAIKEAQGVTPYSNLSDVTVTRRLPLSSGSGRIRAKLNFVSLLSDGDESQNVRLFDGDVIKIGRSDVVLREQLIKAGQTNLSPEYIQVYVSGRVESPGEVVAPQGSTLSQAIALAGGIKLLRGRVEFIRFTREGEIDRRLFSYDPAAPSGSPNNPFLMSGDIIRVQNSAFSAGVGVLNELAGPFVGVYSIYRIFAQ